MTFIYAIRNRDTGLVKIGRSAAVQRRFTGIRSMFRHLGFDGSAIELAGCAPIDEQSLERSVHRRLASARVRGEWFRADSPLVRSFIIHVIGRRHSVREWIQTTALLVEIRMTQAAGLRGDPYPFVEAK